MNMLQSYADISLFMSCPNMAMSLGGPFQVFLQGYFSVLKTFQKVFNNGLELARMIHIR
jgi:hypothetical protein